MKKASLIFLTFIIAVATLLPSFTFAQEAAPVYLTLFYGDGCPHCAKEEAFLDKLEKEFPNLKVRRLEVWYNQDNIKLMQEVSKELNVRITGVPFTVIGQETISGYLNDETTGQKIRAAVESHSTAGCADLVGDIISQQPSQGNTQCLPEGSPQNITLPFLGEVSIKNWSLPLLTIIVGIIDGFNPCAMWILLFLISLLLGMEDKRKMWTLGSAFIFVSALTYFLFLAAWLNLFLFLGFIAAIRLIIGVVAIASGTYHLKEWWSNRNAACRAINDEKRKKVMDRLRKITEQNVFWLSLLGIMVLAFTVNLVELVCSAGLPAIYTQILSLAKLPPIQYYAYLLLYIIFYMLDDLIVFIIAMTTLQAFGISKKYTHWANLFGGVIILILGILLIFKPGWIMFG